MKKTTCFLVLLLQIIATQAAISVGRVGVTIGGGGVWIGGGGGGGRSGNNSPTPAPSIASTRSLSNAYTALQAWKSAIKDDPLGILTTWVGSNVCNYKGVFCANPEDDDNGESTTDQIVAGIDLNHANLQGTLVKELSLLTDITLLHLNSNRFTGTIPNTFRNLVSLTELDLSNNQFSGPFPYPTLQIPNLLYLDLRYNLFTGPIPQDLFNTKLDAIFLNNNQFSGQIPQNLGNSPASVINLANNNFNGDIPFSIGYMGPRLKEILLINNQLSGCIPQGIGIFSDLQVFDVSFNSLMGHVPDSISCLTDIEILNLGHNKLSGVLPDLVCSLKSLVNLSVAYNFFSGFSQECGQLLLRNVGFDFSTNCIPGREMQRPQPECSVIPGGGLSCLRIPSVKLLDCGALFATQDTTTSPSPSSP